MPKLDYRVVSPCSALGSGIPRESFSLAMTGRIDAIVIDAHVTEFGPYFLGTGESYFDRDAVKADFAHLVEAAKAKDCLLVIGNCGSDVHLEWMAGLARDVFSTLNIQGLRVAVISAQVASELVIDEFRNGQLRPSGLWPDLSEEALRDSIILGQMGVHPIITAIEQGARCVLAGRAYGAALFAADMIRRGVSPGLAYHAGHILQSGALACDPGASPDCIVAEIYSDGTALFALPNKDRHCTGSSLAVHSLYRQSHPQLQIYPEGILTTEKTRFFSKADDIAGLSNSRLVHGRHPWQMRVTLEAARCAGQRRVSLLRIDPRDLANVPEEILVYGRNGVETRCVTGNERELCVIVEARATTLSSTVQLASFVAREIKGFSYPKRQSFCSGNIAFPLSPETITYQDEDGTYGAIALVGTRDALFQANYEMIKAAVLERCKAKFKDLMAEASVDISEGDMTSPVILLRTIDRDPGKLHDRHIKALEKLKKVATPLAGSRFWFDICDSYTWSMSHVLQNEDLVRQLFPITLHEIRSKEWLPLVRMMPEYTGIGETDDLANIDPLTLSLIDEMAPAGILTGYRRLSDMAIIRSSEATVNRLTFDIVFTSIDCYEAALLSNAFCGKAISALLGIRQTSVIGTFFADSCNAIKITIERLENPGSDQERDVFASQQQAGLERLLVPIYEESL